MIGSEGVTRHMVNKLRDNMPAKLAELRARAGVSMKELPEVQRWFAHDLDELEVGGFPAVLVTETESTGQIGNREITYGTEADEYTFEYVLRIFCWAMGDSAGGTSLSLKRYIQAIEELSLYNKLLYSNADGNEYAKVDPKFIKHSYSDVAVDGANQVLAAGYVELHIVTRELLGAPPVIVMDGPLAPTVTITTDTALL